jgi:hypothetical protein
MHTSNPLLLQLGHKYTLSYTILTLDTTKLYDTRDFP